MPRARIQNNINILIMQCKAGQALPVKITYLEKLEDLHETASMKTGA